MRSRVVAPAAAVLLLGSSLPLSSCSGLPGRRIHEHTSLPQASDPATGGSQVALAAAVAAIQKPVTTVRLGQPRHPQPAHQP